MIRLLKNLVDVCTERLGLWVDELRTQRTVVQAVDADRSLTKLKALTGSTVLADDAMEAAAVFAVVNASPAQISVLVKIVAKGRIDAEDIHYLNSTLAAGYERG